MTNSKLLNIQKSQTLSLILFTLFSFMSCQQEEINTNLSERKVKVIGHGGMGIGQVYPMNSYESLMYALSLGSDGLEIDVQMTKDGVLVAFHDEELETKTDKKGKIYEKNWNEIEDAVYKNSTPYTRYRLIRLEDIFEHIPNIENYILSLDVKGFNPDNGKLVTSINSLIEKYKERRNIDMSKIYIELKRNDLIELFQKQKINYSIFAYEDFDSALEKARKYKLKGITVQMDNLTKENVELAHQEGFLVATLNTHSKNRNIEAINKEVDYIQTDKVKHLLKILR